MPKIYSYTFTSDGEGPWWGIRCSKQFYEDTIRSLDSSRCFVYLTNVKGETLAIAIEGPHKEDIHNAIFVPSWVFKRLEIEDGDDVIMDAILDPLPKGEMVTICPMTGSSVEGPMFLEGLTESLNQLGIVQEGILSAIVDPSVPVLHEFMIKQLTPTRVCLADGELQVELERAMDRPLTPEPSLDPVDFDEMIPSTSSKAFVPFSGKGYKL
jgi:hypothetical protein